jgi:5-methylcytosine-specific restriction endonuclease McrA
MIKIEWKILRKIILSRDGYKCRYPSCEKKKRLGVHHLIPRIFGGSDHPSNLIFLCSTHHRKLDMDYLKLGKTRFIARLMRENILLEKIRGKLG